MRQREGVRALQREGGCDRRLLQREGGREEGRVLQRVGWVGGRMKIGMEGITKGVGGRQGITNEGMEGVEGGGKENLRMK